MSGSDGGVNWTEGHRSLHLSHANQGYLWGLSSSVGLFIAMITYGFVRISSQHVLILLPSVTLVNFTQCHTIQCS